MKRDDAIDALYLTRFNAANDLIDAQIAGDLANMNCILGKNRQTVLRTNTPCINIEDICRRTSSAIF